MRNRNQSPCRCPKNACLFISSWRKELVWPKRASSEWNKTRIKHALVLCGSLQAVKVEKLSWGLPRVKGVLHKDGLPTGLLGTLSASLWGALPLPSGQAGPSLLSFPTFHSASAPRRACQAGAATSGCVLLDKSLSPSENSG